jgi:hypothetical protein
MILWTMDQEGRWHYFLIRERQVLVRYPQGTEEVDIERAVEFFDVRTGVQMKDIHPAFRVDEPARGYPLSEEQAALIIKSGTSTGESASFDLSKVVSILEVKQRRLDSVVADSIIDQVRVIRDILQDFLNAAAVARPEQRFWLSQQVLSLLPKFSGRELSELKEILDWMKRRPGK